MSATCPSCGCHQPEGLLCHDDTAAVETMLAAVPQLVEQLDVAIAKMAKLSTGKAGKGSAHERSPINWGIVAVRDALTLDAAWIEGWPINELRRHPQVAEMVSSLGRTVKDAYRAIDRARDRKYLGRCSHVSDGEATCGCNCHGGPGAYRPACNVPGGCGSLHQKVTCYAELWVRPGVHKHTCKACNYTHDVAERRERMLEDAEDLIVTPREASQVVGEVGDMPIGHQRIRNYLDRARIPKRPSPDGVLRFRLGDLLMILREDAARHDVHAS